MKRREWLQAAGTAVLASGVVGCSREEAPPAAPDVRHWRMATAWPDDMPGLANGAVALAAAITRASAGRLSITVHHANSLVPAFDVFDAVGRGDIEMGHAAAYYWKSKSSAAPFFCAVPFGMTASAMDCWLQAGGMTLWRELYGRFGLVPFAAGNTGMQLAGWFTREIRSVDDLVGLRIRMPGLGGEVMARLGATAVNLPGAELLESMRSGAIQATEWLGPDNDLTFGLHEVATVCHYPGWQEPGATIECIVNKLAFDALPDDLKAIIETCCDAANGAMLADFTARNQDAVVTLRDVHEVDFKPLPREVLAALRRATAEVLEAAAAQDEFTARVYASAKAFQAGTTGWRRLSEEAWFPALR